jgi:hypothetical protein
MSAESNTSYMFALLFPGFKVVNNFKQNTKNESILNVPSHILHHSHTKISVYLSGRFTTDHNHYTVNIKSAHAHARAHTHTRKLTDDHASLTINWFFGVSL